jgi:transposase
MATTFKSWDVDQVVLLPPSVQELVPAGHLAHFVRDLVRESLDVSAILATYAEDRGFPPYDPTMMTALLLYAYCQGLYASRRIAKACEERVDFMAVTARQSPDFRTISDFRKRHLLAVGGLFTQVLQLCQKAGLVSLGRVALDGTKIRANASKHKAMNYGRMQAAEVAQWLAKAAALDVRDDAAYGVDRRGDELPDWVAHKPHRWEKIRAAKATLEADAEAMARKEAAPSNRPRRIHQVRPTTVRSAISPIRTVGS